MAEEAVLGEYPIPAEKPVHEGDKENRQYISVQETHAQQQPANVSAKVEVYEKYFCELR